MVEFGLHHYAIGTIKWVANSYVPISIGYFVIFHGLVFVWQAVGVIRACDHNISQRAHIGWTRAAQFGVIIGFTAVLVWAVTLGQMLLSHVTEQEEKAIIANTAPEYVLSVTTDPGSADPVSGGPISDRQILHINGLLAPGITREVKNLVEKTSMIKRIVLNSTGGNIFEARGLARLIRDRGMITHSTTGCYSACTTAYIAGKERLLDSDAKLGFHQYRIDTRKLLPPTINVQKEQSKDLSFYQSQGIDPEFLQKVFSVPHNEIWFPTHAELLEAGIVTDIVSQQ